MNVIKNPLRSYMPIMAISISIFLLSSCNFNDRDEPAPADPIAKAKISNIVVIIADDQPTNTLWAMPILRDKMAANGVTFTEAIVTDPECCPFRGSFFSGGYQARNTGVLRNSKLNGAIANFDDRNSLAVNLQESGYRTGFVGRYMHGYQSGYIPPGWDTWIANAYYAYDNYEELRSVTFYDKVDQNPAHIRDVNQYVTDFQSDQALNFLNKDSDKPFFLVLGLFAPHGPFFPATEDAGKFENYQLPLTESHFEDVSDKPMWIQRLAELYRDSPNLQTHSTEYVPRKQLEMLQSVDRAVGKIMDKLASVGSINDTVVFYTSDNGLSYGHHGVPADKGMPYEESIKVPLVVYWPNSGPLKNESLVATNLDIGATIFDLAEIPYLGDGKSLVNILTNTETELRNEIFIENYGYMEWRIDESPIWAGIKSKNHKFVIHSSGERELYDLTLDPMELTNIISAPSYESLVLRMTEDTISKQGVTIVENTAHNGILFSFYNFSPKIFGGTDPFFWSIESGELPLGLELNEETGEVSGIPIETGIFQFTIQVTGNRILSYANRKEKFKRELTVIIE